MPHSIIPQCRSWLGASVLILASTAAFGAENGATLVGTAVVIDGDTIDIHSERFRIEGIDAPERDQMCLKEVASWPCGKQSALALDTFIARRPVECAVIGHDNYRRNIGKCAVGGRDLADFMAREGWAIAYRKYSGAYVAAEDEAHREKRNMWNGRFEAPWDFRRRKQGLGSQ